MILRCTKRLLTLLRAAPDARQPEPGPDDWYANLLWFDRRKCLLLTHAGTLFTIFDPDVRAASLRDTRPYVTGLISTELARENLPAGTFGTKASQDLIMARTADRSVLGCMNDMAVLCAYAIAQEGGLASTDTGALNQRLRRNINSTRGYQRPINLAAHWQPAPQTSTDP